MGKKNGQEIQKRVIQFSAKNVETFGKRRVLWLGLCFVKAPEGFVRPQWYDSLGKKKLQRFIPF